MKATISIVAVYGYDHSVFDELQLPEAADRDTIIQRILFDNAELSLIYNEPSVIKQLIGNWSKVNLLSWDRMLQALTAEYDPISNYDRHERWTDTGSNTSSEQTTGSTSQTTGTTRKVAGWNNDSALTPTEGVDSTGTGTASNTVTGSGSNQNTREGRAYGNIGVTTSQQMITEEIKLRTTMNIAEIISRSFKQNFCLMVY